MIYQDFIRAGKDYNEFLLKLQVALKPFGMSPVEWCFLKAIAYKPLPFADVADRLFVSLQRISGVAWKMSDLGYCKIKHPAADNRVRIAHLTKAGQRRLAEIEIELDKLDWSKQIELFHHPKP